MDSAKKTWESLARFDPLWSIASRPGKEGNKWDLGEFMATGSVIARNLTSLLEAHGLVSGSPSGQSHHDREGEQ